MKQGNEAPALGMGARMALIAYNVIWWMPVVLVIFGVWTFRAGAVGFVVVTVVRAVLNLYRNNALSIDAAQRFPLRAPE